MNKISAIILTKNSENIITDCIECVNFCDEIILIDEKSNDRTSDIAKRLGAKVISNSSDSFAEKREIGMKHAKYKWILYIDADERVTPGLKDSILNVINQKKNDYSGYRIKRKNYYLGKHEWPFIETLERMFEKSSLKNWRGELHETPVVEGKLGDLNGYLLHFTHTDLTSMVNKTIKWSGIEARLRLGANHPKMAWWRFPRVMLTAFFNSYIHQKGYKAGTVGLIESIYQAFSMFITYARLWELQQKNNEKNL